MKTNIFSQLRTIDTAFKHFKLFGLAYLVACTVVTITICVYSFSQVRRADQRIFVLASGKVLTALASDRRDNIQIEAKDHLRTFHERFFDLSPSETAIRDGINRALPLADRSAERAYNDRREQNFYTNLVSGGIVQRLAVDSITLDLSVEPFRFFFYGTERLERASSFLRKRLITKGTLRTVARSEDNPHGFLIRDLEIEEREITSTP